MSVQTENEVENDFLAGIGRAWWLLLLGGVISVAVGAMALAWPGKTIVVVAILFAIYLIISGIFEIVRSFAHGLTGGTRVLLLITGVLSVVLGIFAIRSAIHAVDLLAIFIGIAFLFRGFASLFLGFDSKDGRGWNIFFGIIMLVGGVIILMQPIQSIVTITWIVGIWLIVIGIYEVIMAFVVRSRLKALV
jgi:uncharacterized membrane protein HdeD (DUF308 family)